MCKLIQKYKYIYRICLIFLVNFCFSLLSNCITVFNNLYKFQFSFSFYFVYFVILMLFVFMITQFCRDILLKVFTFEGFRIILTAICCILNILKQQFDFYLFWFKSNSVKKKDIYRFSNHFQTVHLKVRGISLQSSPVILRSRKLFPFITSHDSQRS